MHSACSCAYQMTLYRFDIHYKPCARSVRPNAELAPNSTRPLGFEIPYRNRKGRWLTKNGKRLMRC